MTFELQKATQYLITAFINRKGGSGDIWKSSKGEGKPQEGAVIQPDGALKR